MLLVSFKRQYPRWLFPGRSDKDPSKKPLKVKDARYWIDSLNPITWLTTVWRIYRHRPDILILQWWTTFWAPAWFVVGVLTQIFLRRPLVVICHNVLPHEIHWWDPWLTKVVLQWGVHFVVHSAEEEQRLLFLLPGAQATIIPLPVFDMFADQRMPREESRKRLGLPVDVSVLLFFGIVREYKGLRDLLTALPKVRARLERVILLVAGEFWEDKRLYLEMIESLGIGDSVIIEDRYIPNEKVALYFSAADVLVVPYRQVTGSAVVQMARGFGMPVVTTAVGGMQDIADNESVMLVKPDDTDALADTIVQFLTDRPRSIVAREAAGSQDVCSWARLVDLIEYGWQSV